MISPGRILYEVYHKPVSRVRQIMKTGIINSYELEKGRKEMINASNDLKEIRYNEAFDFEVYFLTGKKYWYQTAFCLYSMQKQTRLNIDAVIVDDGSFDDALEQQVKKQFPSSTVIRKEQIDSLLDEHLPESRYPTLRARRMEYPHLRKLTDIHILPGKDWKMVLDSDMLFFHQPKHLIRNLKNPRQMLFMEDVEEAYGYPVSFLKELTGREIFPEKLNVGITWMPSSSLNWGDIERWNRHIIEKMGTSYLQEQALTAMIAAKNEYELLPASAYKVLPQINDCAIDEILHHYVADSKYDYFTKGWKRVLREIAISELSVII